ncbi:hypothetical protein IWQ57_004492 [Coemansia nantahalensis]|uniref:Uncharacterized protein n=2 Tax=Coemansia TaxID=4863 RepID=A0ACC1L5R0_9FUNG|nr:hypothetical protein IWQ57_004492 [Coemansia nantahalensis]KAJ2801592.1 hypothetical protein H4R21_002743 [Coemansia helicoidea]
MAPAYDAAAVFASDAELRDAAETLLYSKGFRTGYCRDICPVTIVRASVAERLIVARAEAGAGSATGPLDEGWMATMADYVTSVGMSLFSGSVAHVTTALSLRMLAPVPPDTRAVLVECTMDFAHQPPHATAVFRDAERPDAMFAAAAHTKFIRPVKSLL